MVVICAMTRKHSVKLLRPLKLLRPFMLGSLIRVQVTSNHLQHVVPVSIILSNTLSRCTSLMSDKTQISFELFSID